MLKPEETRFLERAIELSRQGMMNEHGGPFGSLIVKNSEIVGEGCNMVIVTNDPTAHAEIVAIRNACQRLKAFQLQDCDIYTSCEPCPMCLGAIYWARPKRVIYANTRFDAAAIKFDDEFIYQQINADMLQRTIPFIHEPHPLALQVFEDWKKFDNKKLY
jgi:tRNA(Arg) A34 adenosine deaminase TadA